MSTKQIHPHVRYSEQCRKELLRKSSGKRIPHHTRNWWKAWLRGYKAEQLKEKECRKSKTIVFRKDDAEKVQYGSEEELKILVNLVKKLQKEKQ